MGVSERPIAHLIALRARWRACRCGACTLCGPRCTRKQGGNFHAKAKIELSGAGYAEASYFGQVCSTGLTKEGTECIMGEPQVGSTFILNLPVHSQPRVNAEGYGLGLRRRRCRPICA